MYSPDQLHQLIPGSKWFKWSEALWLPRMNAYANPTEEQAANICKQAAALDGVRDFYQKPVKVTSWLRPLEYNKLIGGAPNSFHISGLATDIEVIGIPVEQVKKDLVANPSIYPGRFESDTTSWNHLDLGGVGSFKGYPNRKTV